MLELLTGTGLAVAAGLNAYVPLLILGLASRFLDVVQLPTGWAWIENEWVLGILAVLLVIELVADKVPAVDTVNDILQTVVRPAAGGIVFGSGVGSETVLVSDPDAFFVDSAWVPVVIGVVVALLVHLAKMGLRAAANTVTAGSAAPALSTAEDVASVSLSVFALLLPVLVVVAIAGLVVAAIVVVRRRARRAAERRTVSSAAPL